MRVRAHVEGTVQGVGFRPYVHALATELGLAGFVANDARGVLVEVEADAGAIARFLERLPAEAPPLAVVERVHAERIAAAGEAGFTIRGSTGGSAGAAVAPDAATCDACLAELFDTTDRRYRYPFVNCTGCGPRFTIVRDVPYDRPSTTMAGFAMCPACRAEYEEPSSRRFHAQPNACPACGPRLRLAGACGDPLTVATEALVSGAIVAVKGLGGFHLACRADDESAVATLRARKHREHRPLALMVASVAAGRELVELSPAAEALLESRARPIVLAPRVPEAPVADGVAPRTRELGLMLPYTPLHHLLLADTALALVMTSGNRSDEPICQHDEQALERLAGIADVLLLHDRPIEVRADDSVARIVRGRPQLVRRSRGYVPGALTLPVEARRPLLACGGELKTTLCLAHGTRAWLSHHIGDLRDYEALQSYVEAAEHFEHLFGVTPRLVAHDLHPDYLSTRYALARAGVELVGVQHHHAHLAACLAEHGETQPAVAAIYDGTGHGADGTVWGGELLYGDLTGYERAAHLWPVRMPGGDAAIREPWRMACAWLVAATDGEPPPLPGVDPLVWARVAGMARSGLASPTTTSVGRLFDAVAALCGIRLTAGYEGQAAIELEAACDRAERCGYPLPFDGAVLDARETIRAITADLRRGTPASLVAARFHNALAAATAAGCRRLAEARGSDLVVLSGGAFQNARLLDATVGALAGLRVLIPERVPANDGGLAFGQAAIAAASDGGSVVRRISARQSPVAADDGAA